MAGVGRGSHVKAAWYSIGKPTSQKEHAPWDRGITGAFEPQLEDKAIVRPSAPGASLRDVDARWRIADLLATPELHRPAFQPILSLADGAVVGYEGFSRFAARPTRSPDRWFAEATRVGLGPELQALAIQRILDAATAAGLPDQSFLSVNVSPRFLSHPAVTAAVASVDPSALVIEITEQETVVSYTMLRRAMAPYLDRGVRFAVDDAGAGFASMRHVTELGPAFVKLDAYLVRGMRNRQTLQAFLRALNGFTIEIGAVLIAEGVEKASDLAVLTQTGFPLLAQGYAIARPGRPWPRVSATATRAWLAACPSRPSACPARSKGSPRDGLERSSRPPKTQISSAR